MFSTSNQQSYANPFAEFTNSLPEKAGFAVHKNPHLGYFSVKKKIKNTGGYKPEEWISKQDYKTACKADRLISIEFYTPKTAGLVLAFGSNESNALLAAINRLRSI